MRFVGWMLVTMGGLSLPAALKQTDRGAALAAILEAAVVLSIGLWTRRAGRSIGRIVTSSGSDITHLMAAMTDLKRSFTLQKVVCALVLFTCSSSPTCNRRWSARRARSRAS
jgi:hypothetical protein